MKIFLLRWVALAAVLGGGWMAHAGVTLITHGLNGNADGWVQSMGLNIPAYAHFPGTNSSSYRLAFTSSSGNYYLTATRVAGSVPAATDSGEIVLALDWRQLADGHSYDTYQVAAAVTPALLSSNFISELEGHALAEFPLHLIGHSRGGSLAAEICRQLGTNGVWVDQLTTLDPHPLNDPAFPLDGLLYSAKDAPAETYVNVLFHDNYWQDLSWPVNGKSVFGAYVRRLTNLDGGYSSAHSDVHLWYHGTIDFQVPTSDSEASLTATERANWWTGNEAQGQQTGFAYSLIGGGDRTSATQPTGPGFAMIREGYNQWWDLGAGTSSNRVALPGNRGDWPNVIKFNRINTNQVALGATLPVQFYYQWAQPETELATLKLYLDVDANPANTNQILLQEIVLPGTGAATVNHATTNLAVTATNIAPGFYRVLAQIIAGGHSRHLYAPEEVEMIAALPPLRLAITSLNAAQFQIGVTGPAGQTVILESSDDLQTWTPLATNILSAKRWDYTNSPPSSSPSRFYRGVIP